MIDPAITAIARNLGRGETVQLTINGSRTELAEGTTVAMLVAGLADRDRRVAVAVNSQVVPRSAWTKTGLSRDDSVEVLTATAGG